MAHERHRNEIWEKTGSMRDKIHSGWLSSVNTENDQLSKKLWLRNQKTQLDVSQNNMIFTTTKGTRIQVMRSSFGSRIKRRSASWQKSLILREVLPKCLWFLECYLFWRGCYLFLLMNRHIITLLTILCVICKQPWCLWVDSAAVLSIRVIGPYFFEGTVTGENSQKILNDFEFPRIIPLMENGDMWLQN